MVFYGDPSPTWDRPDVWGWVCSYSVPSLLTLQSSQGGGHRTLLYGHAILLRHAHSRMVSAFRESGGSGAVSVVPARRLTPSTTLVPELPHHFPLLDRQAGLRRGTAGGCNRCGGWGWGIMGTGQAGSSVWKACRTRGTGMGMFGGGDNGVFGAESLGVQMGTSGWGDLGKHGGTLGRGSKGRKGGNCDQRVGGSNGKIGGRKLERFRARNDLGRAFLATILLIALPSSPGEACWWTMHPASKQRSEGEKVRVGDDLILVSVSSERYLVSNCTPVTAATIPGAGGA